MLSIFKLSVLAALVVAQNTCDVPPPVESNKPPVVNPAGVTTLHPNGNKNLCLDVQGAIYANGTPVQLYTCNGTGAQKWKINRGNGQLQVSGTNFCLDGGVGPVNGRKLKIWQCYPGLSQQQWWYTDDDRIAITDSGLCMDVTDGHHTVGNQVQVWACSGGNANQVWSNDSEELARVRKRKQERREILARRDALL